MEKLSLKEKIFYGLILNEHRVYKAVGFSLGGYLAPLAAAHDKREEPAPCALKKSAPFA